MRAWFLMLGLLVTSLSAPARAEEERPWAKGVPKDKQTAALELFRDGNNKLRDALYRAAREKYVDALKAWDHPAIHYNLSLTLMNLDQPVEAYEHLLLALKYGSAPLDAEKMDQALRYKGLVEKQLTKLEVSCEQPGATVRVDGNQIFVGPGTWSGMVRSGQHSISASAEGFVPAEKAETLVGGVTKSVKLELFKTEDLTEYRRLWPAPIPWTVLLAGVAFAGAGVGLQVAAKGNFDAYDKGVNTCATPEALGCVPSTTLAGLKSGGETLQSLAWVGYVVGAVGVVTGSVLLYLNRLQPYVKSVDVGGTRVTVLPSFGPGQAGALLFASF